MKKIIYISEPAYYKKFVCLGGECPVSCCCGWRIDWKNDEVEKLKKTECSPELSELVNTSFEQFDEDNMKIVFKNGIQRCPFLTEDNMCGIQKELGAEYLSDTCMNYPRRIQLCGNTVIKSCVVSCCHVLQMICDDPESMKLENHIPKDKKMKVHGTHDSDIDILNHPQLEYRREIFEFFYEILSDTMRSIETSIVLCAVAARKIDEYINKGQYKQIPEIIKALKPQINNPGQIEKLENVKQNISMKMNFSAALLAMLRCSDIFKFVFDENGIPDEAICNRGIDKFNELLKEKPWAMRNIALNIFLTQRMPYHDIKSSLFDNMRYFASEISAVKFLAVVAGANVGEDKIFEVFQLSVAKIDRSFTHNENNVKDIYNLLNKLGITSPAYLMGILK